MSQPNVLEVDVGEEIKKRFKCYRLNKIVGIIFIWFIPFGPIGLIQSIRFMNKSLEEHINITKIIFDKKAKRKGLTVKSVNIPTEKP